MLRRCDDKKRQGQSMIEYTLVLSIILLVVLTMAPVIKRSTHGMVKIVADQLGNQKESEQEFNDIKRGYLIESFSTTRATIDKETRTTVGVFNYIHRDVTYVDSNALVNLGFTNQIY